VMHVQDKPKDLSQACSMALPPGLEAIVGCALEKNVADR
jgi:hypothetical protein